MANLLMIDLDGTIRRTKSGDTFINDPSDQEIIPEAFNAIQRHAAEGWIIVGITNQLGVKSGHKTLESCIAEQRLTCSLLPELNRILFCPDDGWTCWQVCGSNPKDWFTPLHCFPIEEIVDWRIYEMQQNLAGKYRKPAPGMLMYAMWATAVKGVISRFLYVGDRPEDEAAADLADVPFVWAKDWWEVR